jgi:uncharacterized protein (DUF58 family)
MLEGIRPHMPEQPLIERSFLERLERLAIHWQKSFPGLVGGHNLARLPGAGSEFLDHRSFHTGDDLRSVNWRAYMRLEKMFLKLFHLEPRNPVRILVDQSLSMSTNGAAKFTYARRVAAALTYIGLVRLDSMLLLPFASGLNEPCRASGGRHRIQPVVEWLERLEPSGQTDLQESMRQFLTQYRQRGLVFIISDFLCHSDCIRPLSFLADLGHEVYVIQIWDPADRVPDFDGEVDLIDSETGQTERLWIDEASRRSYTEAFDAHSRALREVAIRHGGRYLGLQTDMPLDEVLTDALMRQRGAA